jgi:hypothetical protein
VSVGTTCPVNVSVDNELERRDAAKKQAVVKGVLEVVEDLLRSREMGLPRVMHVEAHLLYHVDIGSSEGEVLEGPDQATVGGQVADGGAGVEGDVGLSVDRRGAGLAVAHPSTLKDIPSVMALVEEEAIESLPTEMSRKWWRGPRSFMVNCCWRAVVVR